MQNDIIEYRSLYLHKAMSYHSNKSDFLQSYKIYLKDLMDYNY